MYEAYYVTGSLHWRRGWTGELRRALGASGCPCPANHSLRWYRSRLSVEPDSLLSFPWADPEVVGDMAGGGLP